jgi:hypothetical protein
MNINLKSILLINNYLTICKLKNPNSTKTKLVRLYLSHKLNSINKPKSVKTGSIFYIFNLLKII